MNKPLIGMAVMLASVLSAPTFASSHREAPFITEKPKVDATDFYLFRSYEPGREDYITLIANYQPLQDAYGGPNYFSLDPEALYEIHVDNNGDAIEDITFQFQFDNNLAQSGAGIQLDIGGQQIAVPLKTVGAIDANNQGALNFDEIYTLSMVSGDRRTGSATAIEDAVTAATTFVKPFDYSGEKTFGDMNAYRDYVISLSNSGEVYNNVILKACPSGLQNGRLFVGQRKESFSVDLGRVFDLVNFDPINRLDDDANNQLADKNITTLALEVHKDCLVGNGNGVVGAWTSASLRQVSIIDPTPTFEQPEVVGGAWTQVSRLSSPLVNELVIGLADKNTFNASEPKDDAQFARYVTNPTLPAIINLLFNGNQEFGIADIAPNNFPRNDLVAAFLTGVAGVNQLATVTASEMQRLNTALPITLRDDQITLGVAAGDVGGFPNGRRPGDDVVDIALRAVMGAFCHNLPLDLNSDTQINEDDNLLLCGDSAASAEAAAPAGNVAFRDGAPQNAQQFDNRFPYLTTPLAGGLN